jgi:hypothetical protein
MMNYSRPIAATFAMMICAGSMAMAQLPSTGSESQSPRWQEPSRLQVVELERTSSREYSYLIFDFDAKTVTLVKVDLSNGFSPITVTKRRLD